MSAVPDGYVVLLRQPGTAAMLSYASAARLVYGVLPLALLLLLTERRSSYAEAGAVVGAYGLAAGVLGPTRARLVDRVGARLGLPALAAALALCLVALVGAARSPLPVVVGLGLLAGCCPPPVGPVMRTAWRSLVGEDEVRLRRAYALDAVTEEAAYVIGPVLATSLLAWVGGAAVVIAGAAVLLVAVSAMGRRAVIGDVASPGGRVARGLWRDGSFLLGLVPVAALGLLLGAVEVAAVAAALASVGTSLAGVPSTALTVGSLVGGLLYGRRAWRGGARAQAVVLTLVAALLVGAAGLVAGSFGLLVAVLAVAGLTISPAVVASYLVADEAAPAGSSEATSWVNAAFNTALAGGTAASAVVVQQASPAAALGCAAVAAALMMLLTGAPAPWRGGRRSAGRMPR